MRKFGFFGMLAAVASAGMALASPAIAPVAIHHAVSPERKNRRLVKPDLAPRYRRSRGPQAKPKRRSNRLHISRRVRRRHRRAR